MLLFADFYDIKRPVSPITRKINSIAIKDVNLITAMECVTKLEKVESCKEIANSIEEKCVNFFERQYRSAKAVGSFVNNNFVNFNLVNRLLLKSTNLNTVTGEKSTCKRALSHMQCLICKNHCILTKLCENITFNCSTELVCKTCLQHLLCRSARNSQPKKT